MVPFGNSSQRVSQAGSNLPEITRKWQPYGRASLGAQPSQRSRHIPRYAPESLRQLPIQDTLGTRPALPPVETWGRTQTTLSLHPAEAPRHRGFITPIKTIDATRVNASISGDLERQHKAIH